jgi:hypothetical protein
VPKGIMVVHSRPCDPAREDEYNDWYSNTHLPEVCAIPGIVAARRYKVHNAVGSPEHSYLAIYEIDADDVTEPVQELRARSASGQLRISDVLQLDPPPVIAIYEAID